MSPQDGKVKMDLTEMGSEDMDWIEMAQDRTELLVFVMTVINLPVSQQLLTLKYLIYNRMLKEYNIL
jgi:hypothetical protein